MTLRRARFALWGAALAIPLMALPLTSQAAAPTTTKAFNRCTHDLATALHARVVNRNYFSRYPNPMRFFEFAGPQRMTVSARSAHTNHVIARAVCTYNGSGQVVKFSRKPVKHSPARF